MRVAKPIAIALVCAVMILARGALAGGPYTVDDVNNTGVAQRWVNDTMEWYVGDGKLSSLVSNATATQWIKDQLAKWTGATLRGAGNNSVSTAVVKTTFKGSVGVVIDASNYKNFFNNPSEPRTVIVFDSTGDIFADLAGPENRNTIVGLTDLEISDPSGLQIKKGFQVFNGPMLGNGTLSADQATAQSLFQAMILHELGHLLNLDHAQVNYDISTVCVRNGKCDNGNHIATMYPELLTPSQGVLAYDDIITLSWVYPSSDFTKNFCTITGEIFDKSGAPLKGVNVIATRYGEGDTAAMVDTRSMVSGVMKPECIGDSRYYLHGIVPGHKYQVTYEPIGSEFSGASDFEPLPNPPAGFNGGIIPSPSGDVSVSCDSGGGTIEMASATVDTPNPCASSKSGAGNSNASAQSGTSSKCSLVPMGDFSIFPVAFLALAAAAIGVRRSSRR
ncbi:MAG: hypothetical protein V2A66_00670 [Pseudomonadota bacterium]